MDSRLFHFIKKEFIQLFRDKRMLSTVLMAPIIQLLMFGYVASTDIKHIKSAILDEDKTSYSRTYIQSFKNSGYIDIDYSLDNLKQAKSLMDQGKIKFALHVPIGFGRKIIRGETAQVQALVDGTNSSTAGIIQSYLNQINFTNSNKIVTTRLAKVGITPKDTDIFDLNARIWFNPELKSVYFMVPAIFAQVLMIISLILTTSSIVKEKERGTMEMLSVTPLKPYELILGKLLPYGIIAFADIILIFLVSTLWFNVPVRGSIFLLFLLGTLFMATGLGMGLFISTISSTQRQALMTNNLIMTPQFILSGFIFPVANMPQFLQIITLFIPIRYFLVIVRGLFLKGVGIGYLWSSIWPIILFSVVILTLSIVRFKKKLE